jgi:DNA polymerase-4
LRERKARWESCLIPAFTFATCLLSVLRDREKEAGKKSFRFPLAVPICADMNRRVILLLDMDAFYASIEQRDNPKLLKGQPVIVGDPPPRSVVATASREARKFGIKSGMAMVQAKKLCPQGHFVLPRMADYKAESKKIMGVIASLLPASPLETRGLDEAYIDVSEVCGTGSEEKSIANAVAIAQKLKVAIWNQCQLTCSIGIGSNKNLAKLASEEIKPAGLTIIRESDKVAFLRPKPVKVLSGIGRGRETKWEIPDKL